MFSDSVVIVALVTAAVAIVSALLISVLIVALRLRRRRRDAHVADVVELLQPLLYEAANGSTEVRLPAMRRRDLPILLSMWNHLQEAMRGAATANLNIALQQSGLLPQTIAMLDSRAMQDQLVAATSLGHLRAGAAIEPLFRLARLPQPVVSFVALRSLLRIDAARSLPLLMPMILSRADWPIARIASVFRELGANTVTGPLLTAGKPGQPRVTARLLQLLSLAHQEKAVPAVRSLIRGQRDPEVISLALGFLHSPRDLRLLRLAARHRNQQVRGAAAYAIGQVASPRDKTLLLDMMRDASWLVRFRAAEALLKLPGMDRAELLAFRDGARDRFAADMLTQMLAEAR